MSVHASMESAIARIAEMGYVDTAHKALGGTGDFVVDKSCTRNRDIDVKFAPCECMRVGERRIADA